MINGMCKRCVYHVRQLSDWLIVWCLTLFSTVLHLCYGGQCTYLCFPGVLGTIFFLSHRLLSHVTIVETTDSGERGMNSIAMTIINPRKKCWPSWGLNKRPPVLKPAKLPTELWDLARFSDTCQSNWYLLIVITKEVNNIAIDSKTISKHLQAIN